MDLYGRWSYKLPTKLYHLKIHSDYDGIAIEREEISHFSVDTVHWVFKADCAKSEWALKKGQFRVQSITNGK